jgi:hypothetical protein
MFKPSFQQKYIRIYIFKKKGTTTTTNKNQAGSTSLLVKQVK